MRFTPAMNVADLDTPCLLLDVDVMERNITTMAAFLADKPAKLRPHFKTPKTPEVARRQGPRTEGEPWRRKLRFMEARLVATLQAVESRRQAATDRAETLMPPELRGPAPAYRDARELEEDLALVRPGQRVAVEIQTYAGERRNGIVTYVYPTVDPATRTARIRVELANPNLRLKPGMFATVHLTSVVRDRVLSVPRSAVLATGERSMVFLRGRDGTLEPRQVVVGVANEDRIEIRSGLAAGDTVVASATFLVDAESNLKAALGSMAAMPGMEAMPKPPVRRKE